MTEKLHFIFIEQNTITLTLCNVQIKNAYTGLGSGLG